MIGRMRIYTRTGDDGTTGLFGGMRVSKAAGRVEAYGTIDELNAVLGWVAVCPLRDATRAVLTRAQETCFRVGAFLATMPGKSPGIEAIEASDIEALEAAIDAAEEGLPPLKTFILPGGGEAGARLHVARTVCRRAERALVALADQDEVDAAWIRWTNRLSDLLFVLARRENHEAGVPETPWAPRADG